MESGNVKKLYNNIAENYDKNRHKARNDYTELPTVISLAGDVKNKRILDAGCGLGKHAQILIKKGRFLPALM